MQEQAALTTRRAEVINAVRLYTNGARVDVVVAAFNRLGIDVLNNSEHLRAVAQISTALRLREEPTRAALELLGCEASAA